MRGAFSGVVVGLVSTAAVGWDSPGDKRFHKGVRAGSATTTSADGPGLGPLKSLAGGAVIAGGGSLGTKLREEVGACTTG